MKASEPAHKGWLMRALDVASGLEFLYHGLGIEDLVALLKPVMEHRGGGAGPVLEEKTLHSLLYRALSRLPSIATQDPRVYRIAEKTGLTAAFSQERVTELLRLSGSSLAATTVRGNWVLSSFYNRLLAFEGVAVEIVPMLTSERRADVPEEEAVFSLVVTDYSEGLVSVTRLVKILQALEDLYEATREARTPEGRVTALHVALLDSGSKLHIEVSGLAEPIRAIAEMFSRLFNSIRFWKYDEADRASESIKRRMETVLTVQEVAEIGGTEGEAAKRLQVALIGSAAAILENGGAPVYAEAPAIEREAFLKVIRETRRLPAPKAGNEEG